jgi:hypothetical protein
MQKTGTKNMTKTIDFTHTNNYNEFNECIK